MKRAIFTISLLLLVKIMVGQTGIKIGICKSQDIISSLPESILAQKRVEAKQKTLKEQMEIMNVEYNNKVNDFMANEKLASSDYKKWPESTKAGKEKEIQNLQTSIQEFQTNAQNTLQTFQSELYKPILEKVQTSIELIAQKYNYSIIVDINLILYHSNDCDNVKSLICKDLNISFQDDNTNKYLPIKFPKFGICKSQDIITSLPESILAQKRFEAKQKTLKEQMEIMNVEYNNKVNDFMANEKLASSDYKKWPKSTKAGKEKEIQNLQTSIQEFQTNAQNTLQTFQSELFKPILEKVERIIKEVAKENNMTLVLDVNAPIYIKPNSVYDISNDCKVKLGLTSDVVGNYNNLKSNLVYGFIMVNEIYTQLPEYKQMTNDIKEIQDQLNKKQEEMQLDFDNQVQEYSANEKYYSQSEKDIKGEKIQKLQESISTLQNQSQEKIERKNKESNESIVKIMNQRITEICQTNNIDIVFSTESLLYIDKTFINIGELYFNSTSNLVVSSNDNIKPIIIIIEPQVKRGFKPVVQNNSIVVKAEVTDESGISEVYINNQKASFVGNKIFQTSILLGYGDNTIVVQATDTKNNIATEQFQMERKDEPIVNNNIQTNQSGDKLLNNGKFYALIIGNNNYSDNSIVSLNEPVNDATKLYEVLTKQYTFELQNVTFIKNATFKQMINAFDNLSNIVTPNDNLLVFYAGHGYWNEIKKLGYWFPTDAEKNSTALWIPNSRISDYMGSINSKHTLLIADACFSGSIFKTRSAFKDAQPAINKLYELSSKKAMTSGNLKEVPDQSVFMHYLVKRLTENSEKYISSDILFSSFRQAVLNNSSTEPQYGTIQNAGDEGGEFIFIKR